MRPWIIFIVGSVLLALVVLGTLFLNRYKYPGTSEEKKNADDARILYMLLGLASLSILAYIAFTFGKR